MNRRLIVYAKRPLPGYAKTRLGADLGMEPAAGIYARLLYAYLFDLMAADLGDARIELSVATPEDAPFFVEAFPEIDVQPQSAGSLGQRMAASFAQAFAQGADVVVLTGTDIPALGSEIVAAAFHALEREPLVLGPATDGGYYLVGMRAPGHQIFGGIEWSTSRVLEQTLEQARSLGLEPVLLPKLADLDGVDEYRLWRESMTIDAAKRED